MSVAELFGSEKNVERPKRYFPLSTTADENLWKRLNEIKDSLGLSRSEVVFALLRIGVKNLKDNKEILEELNEFYKTGKL